jgi:acetyl esterase/lipase
VSDPVPIPSNAPPARETYVYKTVEGCEIKADVIGASPGASKPCVIWIHGGGLIFGSRTNSPRPTFVEALLQRNFVVVSIDHRLAPETKLPVLVEDVRDAWRWIRDCGPSLWGIDPGKVAMAGGSAGTYLALMSGYWVRPRPRVLASFWGYGDITAPWEAEPSAFYREMPLVSREEADRVVGTVAISEPPADVDRAYFYLYCRQQGRWPIEVAGRDPREDAEWFKPYCPLHNITANYPPAILIHGTSDTDVPHEESENLAMRFAEVGVEHEFLSLEKIGHGFAGATPEQTERAELAAADFLQAHLR